MPDFVIQLAALLGGFQLVLSAATAFVAKMWLEGRQREEQARIDIELERVKSDLEVAQQKTVYANRIGYDAELRIYTALWPSVSALKEATFAVSFGARHSGAENERAANRSTFDAAVRNLHNQVERQRPFFAAKVAHRLNDLIERANAEVERDQRDRALRGQQGGIIHAEGVRNLTTIAIECNAVCELIRERLTGGQVAAPESSPRATA